METRLLITRLLLIRLNRRNLLFQLYFLAYQNDPWKPTFIRIRVKFGSHTQHTRRVCRCVASNEKKRNFIWERNWRSMNKMGKKGRELAKYAIRGNARQYRNQMQITRDTGTSFGNCLASSTRRTQKARGPIDLSRMWVHAKEIFANVRGIDRSLNAEWKA